MAVLQVTVGEERGPGLQAGDFPNLLKVEEQEEEEEDKKEDDEVE